MMPKGGVDEDPWIRILLISDLLIWGRWSRRTAVMQDMVGYVPKATLHRAILGCRCRRDGW